ncbi:hypothetical protein EE612_051721 [Oryza sativa]|nr:hypothetical protein EE612_051721 [Oryza sativa]
MAVAKWERAKRALATRLCVRAPRVRAAAAEAEGEGEEGEGRGRSVAASPPAHVASSRRLSRCGSRSSTKICAICLGGMCSGNGKALFTAECSHKFHFHCISSSVRHGNTVCPICRAVWKELPFQGPLPAAAAAAAAADASLLGTARVNPHPLDDRHQHQRMAVVRRLSRGDSVTRQWQLPIFRTLDGGIFDDDEQLDLHPAEDVVGTQDVDSIVADEMAPASVGITTYAAFPAMEESVMVEEFAVLIHLKAPSSPATVTSRAPIDLVTVLDVSWSMAGTKLALLKRAMSFVIQALGPGDRLSVVTFSSSARRLFPLRKMTESGRQRALQRVSSLVADGGTNIADALRKAARVMEDRRERNPVCSIVLLSDGRDTYTVPVPRGGGGGGDQPDYAVLVPSSLLPGGGSAHHVQRATARGDSTELTSVIHTYQTPFMVDMLQRSQTLQPEVVVAMSRSAPLPAPSLSLSPPPPPSQLRRRSVRPAMSFPGRRS